MAEAFTQLHSANLVNALLRMMIVDMTLTYDGAGNVVVDSPLRGITAAEALGITTLVFPTAPRGYVAGLNVQVKQSAEGIQGLTFDPTTGAMTFVTIDNAGAAVVPALGEVISVCLHLYESAGAY